MLSSAKSTLTTRAKAHMSACRRAAHRVSSVPLSRSLHATSTLHSDANTDSNPSLSQRLSNIWSTYNITDQRNRIEHAERLFRAAQHRASQKYWHVQGRVCPHEFRAHHGLLTLNVWLLNKRLMMKNDNDSKLVQEELFDAFWNDTRARIRAQDGISELMVNKHLTDMQQRTFQNCFLLDEGISLSDEQARKSEIGAVVYNYVYLKKEDVPTMLIMRFVDYIEEEYQNITGMNAGTGEQDKSSYHLAQHFFDEGRIGWLDFPEFDNLVADDGITQIDDVIYNEQEDVNYLPDGWLKTYTDAGETYYWHPRTLDVSWEMPAKKVM
mmetsp:Transcript_20937/g.31918  ORF Transcript_20937/g.31918 Transcript_20937/m.31918 type:complete len:324 (+) Transcript_20937:80-1051(+)